MQKKEESTRWICRISEEFLIAAHVDKHKFDIGHKTPNQILKLLKNPLPQYLVRSSAYGENRPKDEFSPKTERKRKEKRICIHRAATGSDSLRFEGKKSGAERT